MDERLPFILALIGGIFGAMSTLGFGAMALFFGALLVPLGADDPIPGTILGLIFGWFFITGLAGCIATFVGAAKLHQDARSRSGATWAIVGGGISMLGGNMIAAALGIVAGVLALSEKPRV